MDELSRGVIFQKEDLVTEKLEVPEWDGFVFVKSLTGKERDKFEQTFLNRSPGKKRDIRGLKALLVVMSTVDSKGGAIFRQEDVEGLNKKSAAGIDRIFRVAQRLSGLTQEDIDELVVGFDEAPSESSGSG